MHLRYGPARPADFRRFYHAFFPHDREDDGLKTIVKSEWDFLQSHPTTLAMMIEDLDQAPQKSLVAFAQAVFVSEAFARRAHQGLPPWVCAQIKQPLPDGSSPLLGPKQIGAAHGGSGLTGLITHWFMATHDIGSCEAISVRDYLHRGFAIFWRGYNLKELMIEATGEDARREAICAGLEVLNDYGNYYNVHPEPLERARPCLLHLTRQKVLDQQGWLVNGAFAYQKPRFGFGFSLREQEMLRWALTGADDGELARMLCLSIWMIRKRWQNIYQRVEEQAPGLLPRATDAKCGAQSRGRGAEKRGALLRFLDARPEELYADKAE